jgi:hypothetical protein
MLSEVERYIEHFKLKVPKRLTADADKLAIKDFERRTILKSNNSSAEYAKTAPCLD